MSDKTQIDRILNVLATQWPVAEVHLRGFITDLKREYEELKARCAALDATIVECGFDRAKQRAEAAEQRARENEVDAKRYRWLRSRKRRDHKHHTQQCMHVAVEDWGKNLGDTGNQNGFWSQKEICESELDQYIDAALHSASASAAQTNNGSET